MEIKKEYTVMDLAFEFKKTPATIYNWINSGRLKSEVRPLNQRVITYEALQEFLKTFDEV